ncbi:glycosyltransferase family 2 protein [Nocardioides mangrovicus]|uniref:Glycosyltransferase family 2 protein n=1 Tax=Nocardioides mangrovicus TaxID=2478913 RepID=A0A3L8P2R2_9ACTN|nr:glycosyltransferase family A protein [Nocardioides mangrovicus]RLV49277.1 glycosyltransferase family 2 protein [Nocardioides mangrovicus]
MSEQAQVDVVIPCFNGAATLRAQLSALAEQQSSVPFRVVVADNGSTDGSAEVVAEFDDRFEVADASARRGINHARNAGIAHGAAPLVLLCDVDDLVHPGWVEAYWRCFSDGAELMGGSLRRVSDQAAPLGEWQRVLNDNLGFLPWATGANCGFARSVVGAIGPFDESYRGGGDETEWFWRAQLAGHRLVFVDDAAIDYVRRPTTAGAFRQNRAFGASHVRLYRQFGAAGMPRPGLAPITRLLPRTVLGLARSPRDPVRRRALVAQLGQWVGRAEALRRGG